MRSPAIQCWRPSSTPTGNPAGVRTHSSGLTDVLLGRVARAPAEHGADLGWHFDRRRVEATERVGEKSDPLRRTQTAIDDHAVLAFDSAQASGTADEAHHGLEADADPQLVCDALEFAKLFTDLHAECAVHARCTMTLGSHKAATPSQAPSNTEKATMRGRSIPAIEVIR
jgi:hypothetical protein